MAAVVGVALIFGIRWVTSSGDDDDSSSTTTPITSASALRREGSSPVSIAASREKAALMGQIAVNYRNSGRTVNGACYDVTVRSVASGTGEAALSTGWDEGDFGARPDVWTPAASTWVSLLRNDLVTLDRPDILPASTTPFPSVTSTPLVLAMPQPMAEALGWPTTEIGWSDVLALAKDPQGWATKGHPEWGKFTLGKTNPDLDLRARRDDRHARRRHRHVLRPDRQALERPEVQQYLQDVEPPSCTTATPHCTYLANLQRADDSGAALGYCPRGGGGEGVLDYNAGNPSGDPATLGQHATPKVPLVAVYPKEGTLSSDSPYVVLNAPVHRPRRRPAPRTSWPTCSRPISRNCSPTTSSAPPTTSPAADHQQPVPDRGRS